MELSHALSETVLASAGFFAFFAYLRKLPTMDRILWGTFILCVAIAALCAALRFAGFNGMDLPNLYVKQFAASAGVFYLLVGVYALVIQIALPKIVVHGILILGCILSLIFIVFNFQKAIDTIPTIGIPIVCLLGLWAIRKRQFKIGMYLLLGTFFSVLANFIPLFNLPFNQIDAYCLLLASALICFGLAGNNTKSNTVSYT